MNDCTEQDEKQLQDLLAKKSAVVNELRQRLYEIVDRFHTYDETVDDVCDGLIENADLVIEALKPYKKEVNNG